MDVTNGKEPGKSRLTLPAINCDSLQISCNWQIINNKQFHNAITTASILHAPKTTDYEDVVSLDTCIALQATDSSEGPCMLDIRLTNCQKIARIAIVSEANILEFFKQFGEYERTVSAEFIDEFQDNVAYLAETAIHPPTSEAGIKFAKTKAKGSAMWIYGIRLILTDPVRATKSDIFDYDLIRTFLGPNTDVKMSKNVESAERNDDERYSCRNLSSFAIDSLSNLLERQNQIVNGDNETVNANDTNRKADVDIRTYIDNKFYDMEKRLMKRIDEAENNTNEKLDAVLRKFEARFDLK